MEATLNVKGIQISRKDAVNIAKFIKGKELEKSKQLLSNILTKKTALPHLKYKGSSAHKKGNMMAGSYPINAITEIIKLLNSIESNARNKGMIAPFILKHISANNGGLQWHYGRQRRHRRKNTNIEMIIIEKEPGKKETKPPKEKESKANLGTPNKDNITKDDTKLIKPVGKANIEKPKGEEKKPDIKTTTQKV